MSFTIPFNRPHKTKQDLININASYDSVKHCGNGPYAKKAEELIIELTKAKSVFLTPSCTAALEMGAVLAGIGAGDEVILPSYTFSSTVNAIVLMGGIPKFCEVREDTMNIDETKIEELITPRTKLIIPIDYAGIPCEIDYIESLAKNKNLLVLQDSAQSIGSTYKKKQIGQHFDFVAFSFHETKNINCGEGGALLVNNLDFIEKASFVQEKGTDRSLVLKGIQSKYQWVEKGSSYLLSDILSSMLLAQLEDMDNIIYSRSFCISEYKRIFSKYSENGDLKIPIIPDYIDINNHAFFVIFDSEKNQESFLKILKEKNIYPYIGYLPLHSSPMGKKYGYSPGDLPSTYSISKRIVRLPVFSTLVGHELRYCIENMEATLRTIYGY